MRNFTGLLKIAGLEKSAKNIVRLLARTGADLAGATARDLKYLKRRGFKGLKPTQVKALREKGFLPTVEQELDGFNRGTENMLKWTPKVKTPEPTDMFEKLKWGWRNQFATPAESIVRTNEPGSEYSANLGLRKIIIPDVTAKGSIKERELRNTIARHEAREWVRGNVARAKGRNMHIPGKSILGTPKYVGTSHMPGVIHDERVFRSQLANKLGLESKWSDLPLRDGVTRGARDVYVGNKPLSYEFALTKQLQALSRQQSSAANSLRSGMLQTIRHNPVFRKNLEDKAFAALHEVEYQRPRSGLSEKDIAKYFMQRLEFKPRHTTVLDGRNLPYYTRNTIEDYADDLVAETYSPISKIIGVPFDKLEAVARGNEVVLPEGSELARVAGLAPYVKKNGRQIKGLIDFGF